nr:immunoglobulin heavy chain junction region [Macaca mulatta]MOW91220.1 immunoglobulin heavy chain junction region [Macaca mulatta]MOW93013.1 immunoglobulin heavy chain junction region [Macaca mulatta]
CARRVAGIYGLDSW